MASGLTRTLLAAFQHPRRDLAPASPDAGEHVLRVDHVVFAEAGARLVLPALLTLGVTRLEAPFALMGTDPRRLPPSSSPSSLGAEMHDAALGLGMHVSRPGSGRIEAVYVERFASPGRLAAAAGEPVAVAGALGTLVLECGELELAAVLAGAPRFLPEALVLGIRLRGSPAPFVSGQDVACEIARRLAPRGAGGRFVDFSGPGVASLTMADRMILAGTASEWGAAAALFPTDDVTRAWLRARGRESDWKKIETDETGEDARLDIDLGAIEPQFADLGRPETARHVPAGRGPEVRRVVIGPCANAADLLRLAQWVRGRELHPGTALTLLPGSRERLEAAAHGGELQHLTSQGAEIVSGGPSRWAPAATGDYENGLCYGVRPSDLEASRTRWWAASLECCAAGALTGRLTDPRTVVLAGAPVWEPESVTGSESWVLRPLAGGDGAPPSRSGLPVAPAGRPLAGPVRGVTLLAGGDGTSIDDVLPWGARIAPFAGDIEALRVHAFEALDPGFARRALAHGGGFVLAGEGLGRGGSREQAALALVALGVRAAIARSWDPVFRRQLRDAGALALSFGRAADLEGFAAGDELELPTLPHGLEPGRPLVLRNLTRGTQFDVRHDLDARGIAIARAGGLLRFAAQYRAES
ncbi:MAG TPA: aconitase family protein [Candidatus Eisenbacteria bacterium]